MNSLIKNGLIFGLLATVTMTAFMLIGNVTGISPIAEPIPIAIMHKMLPGLEPPFLMIAGVAAHLAYGAFAGMILYLLINEHGNIFWSIGYGVLLWLIMQLFVLPIIGWGQFGTQENSQIVIATLILHLIYGTVLGAGFRTVRKEVYHHGHA